MYYIEVTFLPTPEITNNFLWKKIFPKIHSNLVALQENGLVPIGLSFPEYSLAPTTLGTKLRFFAKEEQTLEKFDVCSCLKIFSGYIHITRVREVPDKISQFVAFQRVQTKTSINRLARRKAKRKGILFQEALDSFNDFSEKKCDLPYVSMSSGSSNESFLLFIEKKIVHEANTFLFNTYGLSKGGLVPDF